jgi:hypothetical protein
VVIIERIHSSSNARKFSGRASRTQRSVSQDEVA